MKKIIVTLAVLLLAAPAMASVDIVCTPGPPDSNTFIVSFSESEAGLVRAIALDIQIHDPNVWIEDVNCVHAGYNIYPGSIDIDAGGNVIDYGTCAGVIDVNLMISEQGSLYAAGDPAPEPGDLFIITLGGCTKVPSGDVSVTVSENALRGGVVMEDPALTPTVNLTGCTVTMGWICIICTLPNCCPTCPGDIDGNKWVMTSDMFQLISLLSTKGAPYMIPTGDPLFNKCGDMDGNSWIMTSDMFMLIANLSAAGAPYMIPCP